MGLGTHAGVGLEVDKYLHLLRIEASSFSQGMQVRHLIY